MNWLGFALISACLLGFYEVAKKAALRENSVFGVLTASSWCGLAFVLACLLLFTLAPGVATASGYAGATLSPHQHLLVLGKALLVSSSWVATFFALKHLPLSLAGPLRATSPLYTLLGALVVFGERPSPRQWLGIVVVLGSYLAFSKLGQSERVDLWRSRWAGLLFVGTLLGAASSLYDKHLLGGANGIEPWRLQLWFTVYHTVVLSLVAGVAWWPRRATTAPFEARWSIPAIALLLLVADQFYFRALADHGSLVAVVSLLRRASVLVSFVVGGLWFAEQQLGKKALGLLGVAAGVLLLVL